MVLMIAGQRRRARAGGPLRPRRPRRRRAAGLDARRRPDLRRARARGRADRGVRQAARARGEIPYVAADDREGARQMVRYLRRVRAGERIATITGPLDTSGGRDRLDGYRDVLGTRRPTPARRPRARVHPGRGRGGDGAAAGPRARHRRGVRRLRPAGRGRAGGAAAAPAGGCPRTSPSAASTTRRSRRPPTPPLTTIRNPLEQVAATMVELVAAATWTSSRSSRCSCRPSS